MDFGAAAVAAAFSAQAQTFPGSKPVSIVVPFAAGGPTDRVARDLAERGDSVAVVDKDPRSFRRLGELPVTTIVGVGFDLDVLRGEIIAGLKPGRERADETIIFWHRGFAISDIVVGHAVLARAEAEGVGTMLTLFDQPDE